MELEKRRDGWYLLGEFGEEAGPFDSDADAMAFLDYVTVLLRRLAMNQPNGTAEVLCSGERIKTPS
jgi:hypothetical protein